MFMLKYLRRSRFSTLVADQLGDAILRVVLAIETTIRGRWRKLPRWDLCAERDGAQGEEQEQGES